MLLFYIIMYLMRWCALYLAGGQLACLLNGASRLSEVPLVLGLAAFMWLIGKGLDFMLGHPRPPKFLNTRRKMTIAAVASFMMGFLSLLSMA